MTGKRTLSAAARIPTRWSAAATPIARWRSRSRTRSSSRAKRRTARRRERWPARSSRDGGQRGSCAMPRKVRQGRAEVVFDPPDTPNDVGKVMNDLGKAKIYLLGLIHYPPEVIHDPPDSVNDPSEAEKCW